MTSPVQPLRCLLVEDMEDDAKLLLRALRAGGYDVTAERVDTPEAMRAALGRGPWDLVISDFSMPQFSGLGALNMLQASGHDLPFILVSGAMGEETAVAAMRAGAHDYLLKHDLARLAPAVRRELVNAAERRKHRAMEHALRQSKEALDVAMAATNTGSWAFDLRTQVSTQSLIHDRMFGYAEALQGWTVEKFLTHVLPEDRERAARTFREMFATQSDLNIECRIRRVDGEVRWIHAQGRHERDEKGRAVRIAGFVNDITERQQIKMVDAFLAQFGSNPEGESFFAALARFLAEKLQMDYICIDRLEVGALNATTLAVWHDGKFEDNVTYRLKDTPCGEVVERKVCCYPAHVSRSFPNDAVLQQLQAESYVGIILFDHRGQPIGLIAAIGRRALTDRAQAEALLARVASRAAGELERLLAEAQLQRSEERYRMITENASDLIWLYDLQTARFDYISPSVERLLGYTREELQAAELTTVLTPASAAEARSKLVRRIAALAQGDRREIQHLGRYEHVRKDGSIMIGEVISTALLDQAGQPIKILGVARDITAQEQSRIALERREEIFSSIVNQAVDAVGLIDTTNGSFIEFNRAAHENLGYTHEEFAGLTIAEIEASQSPEQVRQNMAAIMESGRSIFETLHRHRDGSVHNVRVSACRVHLHQRECITAIWSDITETKRTQTQLQLLAEELRARNGALTRFNVAAVGRELRMIELKREVNELCTKLGEPPRHRIAEVPATPEKEPPP